MAYQSSAKVFCRYCGGAVPKATTTHYFGQNSGMRLDWVKDHAEKPASKEEAQRLVNERLVQVRWHGESPNRHIYKAQTWDGESYIDQFFCKNACAEAMGRSAAKFNGVHTEDFRRAVEAETQRVKTRRGSDGRQHDGYPK